MRYLLDTHAVIWLLTKDSKLPKDILESVTYCEDDFCVSEMSLIEIVQLQQGGKLDSVNRPEVVRKTLVNILNIRIEPVADDIIGRFYDLPMPMTSKGKHSDPFDRLIIATALKRNLTLVSADGKFPWYRDNCGLRLMQI